MPRGLPPFDLIARALAALGRSADAVTLLELSIARGGEERFRAEGLLRMLRARPDERPAAPALRLDADLVEAMVSEGRLREARIVARALDFGASVRELELAQALEEVLAPHPENEDPAAIALFEEGCGGSLLAAQRVVALPAVSPVLRRRAQILVQLLGGFRAAPSATAPPFAVAPAVREVIAQMFQRRDLAWGVKALTELIGLSGAFELRADALLLASAFERAASEEGRGGGSTASTDGLGVALLHARMFDFEQPEHALRRLLLQRDDGECAALLAAVFRLRSVHAAGADENAPTEAVPAPPAAPPEWLNKRARKPSVEGWASSPKRAVTPTPYAEVATSILRPDEEAELHLRAGRPDKAIALYRQLAERFPDRPRFRQRADELAAQVAAKEVVFADEMTIRRDLRPLAAAAQAFSPGPEATSSVSASAPMPPGLDDEPTALSRVPVVAPRAERSALASELDGSPPTEEVSVPEEETNPSASLGMAVSVRPIIGVG